MKKSDIILRWIEEYRLQGKTSMRINCIFEDEVYKELFENGVKSIVNPLGKISEFEWDIN